MSERGQPPTFGPAPNSEPPHPALKPWQRPEFRQVVIWGAAGSAAVAAVLVAVLIVTGDSTDGAAAASPTATVLPSASPTASPSASPEPTATALATAAPTLIPTATAAPVTPPPATAPPGPPAELGQGWGQVLTDLNLREQPGVASPAVDRLPADEVVWIVGGPERADGFAWYQVQTLAGQEGWIASGSENDRYAIVISEELTLVSCGAVNSEGGVRVDGLRPGPLDAALRGAFVLTDATGTDACVTYSLESGTPIRYIQLFLDACGAPEWDGDRLTLKPTSYGDVINDYKVKYTVEVADELLTELSATDDDGLTNKLKTFLLGGQLAKPFACMSVYVEEEPAGPRREIEVWLGGECLVVTQLTTTEATVRAASGGTGVTFLRTTSKGFSGITTGQRTIVNLFSTTTAADGERFWMGGFGGC